MHSSICTQNIWPIGQDRRILGKKRVSWRQRPWTCLGNYWQLIGGCALRFTGECFRRKYLLLAKSQKQPKTITKKSFAKWRLFWSVLIILQRLRFCFEFCCQLVSPSNFWAKDFFAQYFVYKSIITAKLISIRSEFLEQFSTWHTIYVS